MRVGDKAYDLYEAYLFSLVVKAAREIYGAASVRYEVPGVGATNVVRLRTSPGAIYTAGGPGYTHAVITVDPGRDLEVHLGIYVAGSSNVPHECDIAVLDAAEAARARAAAVAPKAAKLLLAIEAKYYAANLPLRLAREYLGLQGDLGNTAEKVLVSSSTAPRVMTLLSHRLKTGSFHANVVPGSSLERDDFASQVRTILRIHRDR
jgi:hypothetical protein